MKKFVWTNPYLPITLQIPLFIGYMNLAFAVIFSFVLRSPTSLMEIIFLALGALASFGIANTRLWGYFMAIIVTIFPFAIAALFLAMGHLTVGDIVGHFFTVNILSTIFRILIISALLHPESRQFVKTRFVKTIP